MCLSASEPGGPRRCQTAGKIDELFKEYKMTAELLRSEREEYSEMCRQGIPDVEHAGQVMDSVFSLEEDLEALGKKLTKLVHSHNTNELKGKRLGTIFEPDEKAPVGPVIDDSQPYDTVTFGATLEGFIKEQEQLGNTVAIRHRMIPVPSYMPHGGCVLFSSVATDVQVRSPEGTALPIHPPVPPHDPANKSSWYVSSSDMADAVSRALHETDGELYTNQKSHNAGRDSTATSAWKFLAAVKNPNDTVTPVIGKQGEVRKRDVLDINEIISARDVSRYLANYPGDTPYAQKVRNVTRNSPPLMLPAAQLPLLAPALKDFRSWCAGQYVSLDGTYTRYLEQYWVYGRPIDRIGVLASEMYREGANYTMKVHAPRRPVFSRFQQAEQIYQEKGGWVFAEDLRRPKGTDFRTNPQTRTRYVGEVPAPSHNNPERVMQVFLTPEGEGYILEQARSYGYGATAPYAITQGQVQGRIELQCADGGKVTGTYVKGGYAEPNTLNSFHA